MIARFAHALAQRLADIADLGFAFVWMAPRRWPYSGWRHVESLRSARPVEMFHGEHRPLCSRCRRLRSRQTHTWCRPCHAETMRRTRHAFGDLPTESRRGSNARAYTNVLIGRGSLTPEPCTCGSMNVQPHHLDYSNPRAVRWLCVECHGDRHNRAQIGASGTEVTS